MFKRVYIEITNYCNLKCSFCSNSQRPKQELTLDQMETILTKINNYTNYIYLHVKGEPLLHSKLEEILNLCQKYHKQVCLTTNGVFLKDKLDILLKFPNIYQINISLHSENNQPNYITNIIESVSQLKNISYISYRFWTLNQNHKQQLMHHYQVNNLQDKMQLDNHVFVSLAEQFTWPNINDDYSNPHGYCHGGKQQIAILVDGTVSLCCLDSEGVSNLGNIFTMTLEEILESNKYQNCLKGFQTRNVYLDICKHCQYKERFNKDKKMFM